MATKSRLRQEIEKLEAEIAVQRAVLSRLQAAESTQPKRRKPVKAANPNEA